MFFGCEDRRTKAVIRVQMCLTLLEGRKRRMGLAVVMGRREDRRRSGASLLTVWHATAIKGLLMAVVTETMWSMTPSSSGLVTLAMLKT